MSTSTWCLLCRGRTGHPRSPKQTPDVRSVVSSDRRYLVSVAADPHTGAQDRLFLHPAFLGTDPQRSSPFALCRAWRWHLPGRQPLGGLPSGLLPACRSSSNVENSICAIWSKPARQENCISAVNCSPCQILKALPAMWRRYRTEIGWSMPRRHSVARTESSIIWAVIPTGWLSPTTA